MAPELFAGHPATKQSDIYAMGVTYFSLLTGRLPVETQSINELVRFHTHGTNIDIAAAEDDLPDGVVGILRRALAKDFAARYESSAELVRRSLRNLWQLAAAPFSAGRSLPKYGD